MTGPDEAAVARLEALRGAALRVETGDASRGMVWHVWGEGAPLVLLHGGSGSWTHWVENLDRLREGHRVIAGDLPGLGDSPDPPEPYDLASLAAIVADGLDEMLPSNVACDFVSFSFGGMVSGQLAADTPARVRSVTIVGSPILGLPSSGRANQILPVDPALAFADARDLHARNLATFMLEDAARIDALALRLHHENLRRSRLRSRKIARSDVLAQALRRVRCPVHGIWGERDVTVHPDLAALRAEILATGPQATFEVIADAGHWAMYEAPDAFHALLERHLAN